MDAFLTTEGVAALLTLTVLEIVLGIDNIVFISILSGRLRARDRLLAQRLGLGLALLMRILLLLTITWVMGLTRPLFTLLGRDFSARDLILIAGGLVLLARATSEIYEDLEGGGVSHGPGVTPGSVVAVVVAQIALMDIVFSLDSVITAVGMANQLPIMVTAIVIAVLIMLVAAPGISEFIEKHPSVKILALAFLVLIGAVLVAEGTGQHVGKGYIYAAMAFALFVELLNLRYRARRA